ncbi:hypothetical protein GOODEAATRI_028627 [Goodea atripinnis]|uniref:PUM-HD domain-containing protein n=1 Tax=Goodea atripinnis TaxID=208336 RepID=A0ABV0PHT1_9TELE
MAFPHDSVRVFRCFIQFGNQKQRWEVFEELKDGVLTMSKYLYGKHVVKKLLMYGNKELVAAVIQMFKGHIRQMLRHAAASTIVEYAYNDKAVLTQKLMITDELYGPTYAICKVSTHTHPQCSVMSCSCSQQSSLCSFFVQSLEGNTIEKVVKENPEKLENIMDETKQVIVPLTQKEQVIKHSVDHKVFLDIFLLAPDKQRSVSASVFLQLTYVCGAARASCCIDWVGLGSHTSSVCCDSDQEMIESIREAVVYMAHTHDGARVAMRCLWHGTAKVGSDIHNLYYY